MNTKADILSGKDQVDIWNDNKDVQMHSRSNNVEKEQDDR